MRLSRYSFLPISARLKAIFGASISVQDRAIEKVQLAAADESPTLPAVALPNEFSRVLDVEPNSTFDRENGYISSTRLAHGPTIAYKLADAILADHTLYCAGSYSVYRKAKKRPILAEPYEQVDEGQLCSYAPSNIYFGHWLRDALAMELLAETRGLPPLSFRRKPWLHEPGYREMVSLPGSPVTFAHVRRLWIVDDLGLNASWVARFQELRRRVQRSTGLDGPSHVFLARGTTGTSRELVNTSTLMEYLVARGFSIVEPEKLSPREIVKALASAKIVVSVEGSALNHAHYAVPEKSGVLVIQPPERFNAFHKVLLDFNNIRFGYVVGERALGGFTLAPERLLRTLDLLETIVG
ncbi:MULTISPECIES: glycosyltransferase 61 family protein [Bradyrhizobium]|uniref:Glycosyltransferase 61 catalytic domain-containing protein n=2 Tax=Bradyrhizobium TaxID=374 RepID=A0ABY0Q7C5_9BRAD|nr:MULTISPECIES: glycosyltransferase family 61 protein [Bradyrhizobium]SDJ63892.1 Protein of unknown function [Bradyrhizobium ottawaense]SEC32752.1 Protein of unknown function [Bradyrhizobium lablabi]